MATIKKEVRRMMKVIRRATGMPIPVAKTAAKFVVRRNPSANQLALNDSMSRYLLIEWWQCCSDQSHGTNLHVVAFVGPKGRFDL